MKKLAFVAAIVACLVAPVAAQTAKEVLTIDVPNDAATLDPHGTPTAMASIAISSTIS